MTSRGAAEMTKNENRCPSTPRVEKIDQRRDVAAEPHAATGLFEVLTTHAAKLRIVTNEVGQLAALLHEVAAGKPADFFLEARGANELAQHRARIIEAERLVEV